MGSLTLYTGKFAQTTKVAFAITEKEKRKLHVEFEMCPSVDNRLYNFGSL